MLLLVALLLGVSAGLRSMTPLAVVAWAARGWPAVAGSALGFMAAPVTGYVFAALAIGELIADKLPFIPSRLQPGPLGGRIISGALAGTVAAIALQSSPIIGGLVGAAGGLAGSFGGYAVRRGLTVDRKLPDLPVALLEDVVAIGLAVFAVSRI
jgi:uncharacterized membrane protein